MNMTTYEKKIRGGEVKQTKKEPSLVIMGWALVSAYEGSVT